MNRSKLSVGLYLLLVFLSGILVGATGYRLYSPPGASTRPRNPDEYRRKYVEEMQSRLKLNSAQVTQLEKVMDETRQKFHDLHEKTQPQLKVIEDQRKAIQAEYVDKVRAMLNDGQRTEYEKMRAERERRRQQQQQQRDRSHP